MIYKYEIDFGKPTKMPVGAKILHVGQQGGRLFVWAIVNPSARIVDRQLEILATGQVLGTGETLTSFMAFDHLGTVQMADTLVWHVFDGGETEIL